MATTPLASGLAARVNAVVVNSATDATVSYNLTSSGADLLPNQVGTSVYQDSIWKVSDATFCGLLKLIGAGAPAACGAAG